MFNAPPRERPWLSWLFVFAWALVIYATIPLARALQTAVRDNWGPHIFTAIVVSFIVVGLGSVVLYVVRARGRRGWREWLWLTAVAAVYGYYCWALRRNPEESLHFVQYGVLGILLYRALSHRVRDPSIYISAVLIGVLFGTVDEVIQWITPRRFWDLRDVWINGLSVVLAMVAVAKGIRPSAISLKTKPSSVHLCCRLAMAVVLLLALCMSNTPAVIGWYADRIPGLEPLKHRLSMMAEYGYRYDIPDVGAFYSRLTLDELEAIDQQEADRVADIIRHHAPDDYRTFLKAYSPVVDPFIHEFRVHVFRRDHYRGSRRDHAPGSAERRRRAMIAYRENQILEKFFGNALEASRYKYPPPVVERLKNDADLDTYYVSAVSRNITTMFSVRDIWIVAAVLLVILLVLDRMLYGLLRRRPGDGKSTS